MMISLTETLLDLIKPASDLLVPHGATFSCSLHFYAFLERFTPLFGLFPAPRWLHCNCAGVVRNWLVAMHCSIPEIHGRYEGGPNDVKGRNGERPFCEST